MALSNCSTFSLLFFSYFLIMSTLAQSKVVVDITNNLPNDTPDQLKFRCGGEAWNNLKVGDHYKGTPSTDQDFECSAVWGRWLSTWSAYETKAYKGHDTVYWSVRKDGFYRSWEGSNWSLIQKWDTE
ncbi:hypothetical protein Lal_00037462 [Lupinus albus]|uniref:Uncharacterized protein n=1 Tax=Lupinus albus TaxID=3870 RepID=A0A6A4P308_LUPAL|nr:hypothetical protein Lalb_Chr18g0055471 [Lupinus albus]KAF1890891.1 hypothetical protein Lal_00037462 [Lupinus albus]